jgi:hypothetical protein
MAKPYFTNLPIMNYDGYVSVDLLARVVARSVAPTVEEYYFTYVVKDGERADMIASDFYGNPNFVWSIYLINNIIDPAHEWVKTEEDLYSFVIKKYGTYAKAANKIVYYRNNYDTDNTILSIADYNNLAVNPGATYPYNLKRFYDPFVDEYNNIVGYKRANLDEVRSTNKIVELTLDSTDYQIGERITQITAGITTASAFISAKDTDKLIIQHVTGTFVTASPVYGEDSEAAETPSSVAIIAKVIPDEEVTFFTDVTALDYETELNESRKIIRLIRPENIDGIESELRGLFE